MFQKVTWIIWAVPICLGTTLIITVTLAYAYGHVTYYIPYISDTGTVVPESFYFGQGLNILWIIVSMVMYIKFLQVKYITQLEHMHAIEKLNIVILIVGLITAFGISIVANFQELQSMKIHWMGAFLVFGCGSVYICMQTYVYNKLKRILGQRKAFILRTILSIVALVTFFIFYITGLIAFSQFRGDDYLKWKKTDGGFEIHQVSTISEWICATCILSYLCMLYWEFKNISLTLPTVTVKLKTDRVS